MEDVNRDVQSRASQILTPPDFRMHLIVRTTAGDCNMDSIKPSTSTEHIILTSADRCSETAGPYCSANVDGFRLW